MADLSRPGREPDDASQGAQFDGHHDGGLLHEARQLTEGTIEAIHISVAAIAIAAAVETVKRAVGDVVRSDVCRRAANEIARAADSCRPSPASGLLRAGPGDYAKISSFAVLTVGFHRGF